MISYTVKDRYKDMGYGEIIDGEFVEYEDMTEEQLMEIEEQEIDRNNKECQKKWYETYIEDGE